MSLPWGLCEKLIIRWKQHAFPKSSVSLSHTHNPSLSLSNLNSFSQDLSSLEKAVGLNWTVNISCSCSSAQIILKCVWQRIWSCDEFKWNLITGKHCRLSSHLFHSHYFRKSVICLVWLRWLQCPNNINVYETFFIFIFLSYLHSLTEKVI